MGKEKTMKNLQNNLTTKQRIINAAGELMCIHGYKGTTTKMIAETAGVNEITIFRYFKNKEGVILELLKDVDEEFEPIINFFKEEFRDPLDLLEKFGLFLFEQLSAHKDIIILSMKEMGNQEASLSTVFSKIISNTVKLLSEKLRELYPLEKSEKVDFSIVAFMFVDPLFTAFIVKNSINPEVIPLDLEYLKNNIIQILLKGLEGN